MQTEEEAPGIHHTQDLKNQEPSNKEQEKVDFKDKATGIPLENNITDQNNYTFEGLQNQGNNTAGNTDIIPLPQDVEEILGEAEKHPTTLRPQVYLHYKSQLLAAVSKHSLFKFNCVLCVAITN